MRLGRHHCVQQIISKKPLSVNIVSQVMKKPMILIAFDHTFNHFQALDTLLVGEIFARHKSQK